MVERELLLECCPALEALVATRGARCLAETFSGNGSLSTAVQHKLCEMFEIEETYTV